MKYFKIGLMMNMDVYRTPVHLMMSEILVKMQVTFLKL